MSPTLSISVYRETPHSSKHRLITFISGMIKILCKEYNGPFKKGPLSYYPSITRDDRMKVGTLHSSSYLR